MMMLMTDLAGPYLIKFGVESKWSCETTSTANLKHHLVQAFRDMRRVVEAQAGAASETKARL
jgi:carnitine O-acetyltransferase